MINFVGYNFVDDINSLDPYPTSIRRLTSTKIQHGIFNHINISSDTSITSTIPPEAWDYSTVLDCNFDNNISGGNVDQLSEGITEVRIKRRPVGTFDWILIKSYPITSLDDLSFIFNDNLCYNDVEYEYAYVPVYGNVEGQYAVSTILSQFDGVFVCDMDTIIKFYAGVEYGTTDTAQQVGTFTVLGRQYPVVISNGLSNYQTGSVTGMVLPDDYEESRNIDRMAIVRKRDNLVKFLTNKKAKILKDYNGNKWLCYVTSNPQTSYTNEYGQGIVSVGFGWTEIGDAESRDDLVKAGLAKGE